MSDKMFGKTYQENVFYYFCYISLAYVYQFIPNTVWKLKSIKK